MNTILKSSRFYYPFSAYMGAFNSIKHVIVYIFDLIRVDNFRVHRLVCSNAHLTRKLQ